MAHSEQPWFVTHLCTEKEGTMRQPEQWQLSGNAAELYERYVVPYFLGPWAPGLVEVAALRPGERVLDVACGTGVVARLAAQQVGTTGQVTGVDLNAGMLAVARVLPPPPGAPITWVEGNAVAMHLADAQFDVVLCQQGLQFFSDKPAALREMHRVLVPGGRVVLSVWEKTVDPYGLALWEAVERHAGTEAVMRLRASRMVPEPEELSQLLVEAGFRDVHIRASRMTKRLPALETLVLCHLAATPVAEAVAALHEEARAALARDVCIALRSYADGDGVVVPDATNVATAHT
jgi:ubiquinone/menaquinone biosynthesis C-methylase UbiE